MTRIMRANSRLPDFLLGDMWAGIAAARLGARRIPELVERYGARHLRRARSSACRTTASGSRGGARRAARTGRSRSSEEQDSGAVYRVAVEISADELVVDLRDNPDQDRGPANVSRDGAMIAAQIVLMNLAGPGGAANAGHFRPLTRPHAARLGLRPASRPRRAPSTTRCGSGSTT